MNEKDASEKYFPSQGGGWGGESMGGGGVKIYGTCLKNVLPPCPCTAMSAIILFRNCLRLASLGISIRIYLLCT